MPKADAKTVARNKTQHKINSGRLNKNKYELELQTQRCVDYKDIEDIVLCRMCLDPNEQEDCLFKDFRAFRKVNDKLYFGYLFPDAKQTISPLSRKSKRFNENKPYQQSDRRYLKSRLKKSLQDNMRADYNFKKEMAVLRNDFQQYRHLCDFCQTSIFNYHHVCPVCAMELCPACFQNISRHPKRDDPKIQCVMGDIHRRAFFMLCKKYTDEDMEEIQMDLDDIIDYEESKSNQPESTNMLLTPNSEDQHHPSEYTQSNSSSSSSVSSESQKEITLCMTKEEEDSNKKRDDEEILMTRYTHLNDVTVLPATDISLPTTVAQAHSLDTNKFQEIWKNKDPLVVEGCLEKSTLSWHPKYFGDKYGDQEIEVIDCSDMSKHISTSKAFFDSYESKESLDAYCDKMGTSKVIKIKDWPPKSDFKEVFNELHADYMNHILPVPEYCSESGFFNLSNRLPEEYMPPDLGPKMFISQASDENTKSQTKLHCDMADAVNVMCYSTASNGLPESAKDDLHQDNTTNTAATLNSLPESAMADIYQDTTTNTTTNTATNTATNNATAAATSNSLPESTTAAIWDIFPSKDLNALREFVHNLNQMKERNYGLDPILSESTYLTESDLKELEREKNVKPYRFYQKTGDAVFIPAGCAHQVQNIAGSIKCAYDFLSAETLEESHTITNHFHNIRLEDKLQVKSTLMYAFKSL